MAGKIKSVTADVEGPSGAQIRRAIGLALRFNFKAARESLGGTVTINARDASDNVVLGCGGGTGARIFIYPGDVEDEPKAEPPAPAGPTAAEIDAEMNAMASDATVLQDKVTVSGPLKIRKPSA